MSVVGFAFKPFELVQKYLEKIAVIIVNGPLRGGNEPLCGMWLRLWNGAKVRFCTDGAANFLVDLCACNKITYPDFIVGDFDSITTQSIRFFSAKQRCELLRIVEQDTTDLTKTLRALMDNISLSSCLSGILLLGGFNGRFDHILGALNTLLLQVQTRRDLPIFAIEGSNVITVLPKGNTQVELSDQHITGICGIVPIVQRPTIVSSDGLKWELHETKLEYGHLISTSNIIVKPHGLRITCTEPIVFTFELKQPNGLL